MNKKSIIVVGSGHAGVEAAFAISNLGVNAILVTMDRLAAGRMSCNPAIGGLGKGHLVKEIDALGGIMGRAADQCGLQFKTLNTSKGRAVWSPRAQIDKKLYTEFIQKKLSLNKKISIVQDEVVNFSVDNNKICSVFLRSGKTISAQGLVVCSGTFLNGLMHIGMDCFPAGRLGEKSSISLSENIVNKGFKVSRLKTGTPPRLLATSINWENLKCTVGDDFPVPFSIQTKLPFKPKNVPCYIVDTNAQVHGVLGDNLDKSPMYSGKIEGVGPRYCPSIEDKIVRFSGREKHQLFLEPEWNNSKQIYLNGFSTSMPRNIQVLALKKISGFENVELIRPGYAIEYDYFPTSQLKSTLETKSIGGLYFAGQMNGTSGYEEAAAQGLIAGANAALRLLKKEPIILNRNQAYIGVLIDDLITKDINEPYRMFTSRAEHRLSLRSDNAAIRLTERALVAGLITNKQYSIFSKYRNSVNEIKRLCKKTLISTNGKKVFLPNYLKRPECSIYDEGVDKNIIKNHSHESIFTAETDIEYEGYVKIENMRVKKIKKMDFIKIPKNFDYNSIPNLSLESREKFIGVLPETLGQASRIDGVRPSDLGVLAIFLKSSP